MVDVYTTYINNASPFWDKNLKRIKIMAQTAKKIQPTLHDLQEAALIKFRQDLEDTGWLLIPKEYLPWNIQELNHIEKITSAESVPYRRSEYGDTGEKNPVSYFRILHPTIHETCLPECIGLINSNSVKNFFLSIIGEKKYDIDRCQAHMYSKGDFIGLHTDSDSCPAYRYSVMLLLSEGYEGGEFVMHNADNLVSLKPEKYSMVIVKSHYPHEVKEITFGIRRTLVFFIKT